MSHPSDLSPFAAAGPSLIANGYSALPIAPGDKVPGNYSAGEWRMMRQWSKFCSALPPAFQVASWLSWPNAGVGVACGRGLVLVDIDLDEAVGPVMDALPPCNVGKKGAKGLTLAFRGDTSKIRSRAFKINGIGAVDLLADGKQSVLPPSIHPKTGRPYEWMSARTLLDTPLAELAEVPDNLADLIAEALRPLGYKAEQAFEFSGEINESRSQSTDFFRRLNEDALANLDAWVPRLNLYRAIRHSGGWRAVPHWRPSSTGNPPQKRKLNLSFDPKGIRDFGDGGKTYTPINVVMAACDLGSDLDTAAKWLGEWIGYDFSPVIQLRAGPSSPSERAKREAAARAANPPPPVPAPVLAASEPAPEAVSPPRPAPIGNIAAALAGISPTTADVIEFPSAVDLKVERFQKIEALTKVPGLVGQIVDWIEACGNRPGRTLALGAALCAVGGAAGRFYASPTKARTNLYIVGLAESGFGKDMGRKCVIHLYQSAGMMRFLGGSKIMSGSALRKQVEKAPSTVYMLDEYGGLMRDIHDRRAGQHTKMIRDFMLEFYSTAASTFMGADYAGESGTPIMNPNLVVYGTSTPEDFWSGITSGGVADGLIARKIIFTAEGELPAKRPATADFDEPPQHLVDALHAIITPKGGNLEGMTGDGSTKIRPIKAVYGPGAEDIWNREEAEISAATLQAPHEFRPIYNRLAENAQKLALVVAVGVDCEAPVITAEIMEWAFALSWLSTESLFDECRGRLADSDYQRQYLEVRRFIERAGASGLTLTQLKKKLNGKLERRRFEDIIANLKEADDIDTRLIQNPKGGPPAAKFVFIPDTDSIRRRV